jgi:hypothetical protein
MRQAVRTVQMREAAALLTACDRVCLHVRRVTSLTVCLVLIASLLVGIVKVSDYSLKVSAATPYLAGRGFDRNFPCQTLKIRKVSLVVMGS